MKAAYKRALYLDAEIEKVLAQAPQKKASERANELMIYSELVLQHFDADPLDFRVEPYAVHYPFVYDPDSLTELAPYIKKAYEIFTKINYPKPPLLLHFTPCVLPGYEQQMLGWSAFNTMVVNPKGEKRDLDMTAQSHTVKTEA